MGGILEDAQKQIDNEIQRAQQKKLVETQKKAEQAAKKAEKAQRQNDNHIVL